MGSNSSSLPGISEYWGPTGASLEQALEKCSYGPNARAALVAWYQEYIVPALSVQPEPCLPPTRPRGVLLTHNNCPFELSINVCNPKNSNGKTQRTVRFTVELFSKHAGTDLDPCNELAISGLAAMLCGPFYQLDLTWFTHFGDELFVTGHDGNKPVPHDAMDLLREKRAPSCFVAFDLPNTENAIFAIATKFYFFPARMALLTQQSTGTVIEKAIRKLHDRDGVDILPTLDAVMAYLNKPGAYLTLPDVEMLAIDTTPPQTSKPRIKIYAHSYTSTFNAMVDIYTLSQPLNPTTALGIKALEELWPLLFHTFAAQKEGDWKSAPIPIFHESPRAFIVYGFELTPGSAVPEVKIYFPLWSFCDNDGDISARLSNFFKLQGWNDLAESYDDDIAKIFPDLDLENGWGTHTYLSFTYSEARGVYITMYYSSGVKGVA